MVADKKKSRQKIFTWKGTKNLSIVPKLYAVQNNESLEKWCEWLRSKGKRTNHCKVYTIWWAGINIQRCNAKTDQGLMVVNAKILTRVL